ncbi:MAG: zinc ribbon domain-containing protein [Planctomycetota bacterium]
MRKFMFWTVTAVLGVVLLGSSFLWYRSFEMSEQAVVRLGTPTVTVVTTDRGRLGFLTLGQQPEGKPFLMTWRVNEKAPEDAALLDERCTDRGLGFGMDRQVNIATQEAPAVAGVIPSDQISWAARRVVLPFWAIVAFSLITGLIWVMTVGVRLYRLERGLCPSCSTDISQASHFCPKCGKAIPKRTWSGETRPRRRLAGANAATG